MKDYLGRELEVGDNVLFCCKNAMQLGKIRDIGKGDFLPEPSARIAYETVQSNGRLRRMTTSVYSKHVVKLG